MTHIAIADYRLGDVLLDANGKAVPGDWWKPFGVVAALLDCRPLYRLARP